MIWLDLCVQKLILLIMKFWKLQNENAVDQFKKEIIDVATELTKILDDRKLSKVKSRSLVFNGFYDDLVNNQNDENI